MKQSCIQLGQKIKAFESKYVEHYIEDGSKLKDAASTLNELKFRQKMIEDIRQKVDLYGECLQIIGGESRDQSRYSCFSDFKSLEQLNEYTLKLWNMLDEWRNQKDSLLQRPFLEINFMEVSNFIEEAISFFE